jgi:hypothetical protein
MLAPQRMISIVLLVLLGGCSTAEQRPEDQSIVDIVDSAKSAPATPGCPTAPVPYCVTMPGGLKECTCLDSLDMLRGPFGLFVY